MSSYNLKNASGFEPKIPTIKSGANIQIVNTINNSTIKMPNIFDATLPNKLPNANMQSSTIGP